MAAPMIEKWQDQGLCYTCHAAVIWARIKDGRHYKPLAIERCPEGEGHMAIFPTLFADGSAPIVEEVVNGTSYRRHDPRCPGPKSFTGTSRARKLQWRDR